MNCTIEIGRIGASVNIRWIKSDKYQVKADTRPFLPTATNHIEQRRGMRSTSTLDNELTAVRSFIGYAGKNLVMGDITPNLISGYERWLLQKGVMSNTSACYLRSLRAVLNRLGKDGSVLFREVHTGRDCPQKRAVTTETVRKVKEVPLRPDSFLMLARDLFLFSILAMGIPFVDLAHLRRSDIRDGYITYYRRKTRKQVRVKLEPCMLQIINRYGLHDGPYLFPLLKGNSEREYRSLLHRYNRNLALLSVRAGLPQKLTSYTARHTWASMAYQHGIPLAVISKGLGHSNPVTTQNYLKEIDDAALGEANRRIFQEIC